jgi:hypothetical protein
VEIRYELDVAFGSFADMAAPSAQVRSTPKTNQRPASPLRAKCGLTRRTYSTIGQLA